jgi:transposase-like protein
VLVGPSWYMANQKESCKSGDSIRIDAVRTTIDGQKYWIARSIDTKDARVVLLDGKSNTPVWSRP